MDDLNFDFEDDPSWRSSEEKRTSLMLEEITQEFERYNKLSEAARRFCDKQFARAMAFDYVHNLNIGESVGTQSKDETETLLERFLDGKEWTNGEKLKEKLETINTFKAMRAIHKLHEVMDRTGLLTVDQVCGVHRVLLEGLHGDCGKIRSSDVYTNWHDGPHFYPPPEKVESLFFSLIDHHNIHMESLASETTTLGRVKHLFKCAAWLLFKFVDAHPFVDGNGRMCRLLANHVLSLITPFPVHLYHSCRSNRSGRDDYINAIVRCRKHPEEGPRELAAMLVEGAWQGWNCLSENLQQLRPEKGQRIGPIIIQKSKIDLVGERVKRACEKEPDVDVQMIITKVLGETQKIDVNGLKPHQYEEASVKVDSETCVDMKVFP